MDDATPVTPPVALDLTEQRSLAFDVEGIEFRDDNGSLSFEGHAAVFDRRSVDLGGFYERVQRGAFQKILDTNPDVRFLINHGGLPLARSTNGSLHLSEDAKGLRVQADLAPTTLSKDLKVLV